MTRSPGGRMRHQTKTTLAVLVPSLVCIGLFAAFGFSQAREALLQSSVTALEAIADLRVAEIERLLATYTDTTRFIADRLTTEALVAAWRGEAPPAEAREALRVALDALRGVDVEIAAITVLDDRGDVVASTGAPGAAVGELPPSGSVVIRPVLSGAGEPPSLVLIAAVGSPDSVIGSVEVRFRSEPLGRMIQNGSFRETGEILLAIRDSAGSAVFLTGVRQRPDAAGQELARASQGNVPMIIALEGYQQPLTEDVVDYVGTPVVAVPRYLADLDWGVVAKLDAWEVLAPVTRLRNALAVLALALAGLALVSGRILGKRISAVTQQLASELRARVAAEKELQEQALELRRVNRELDDFAYVASHDLKAPLRSIDQLACFIQEDAGPQLPDASREDLLLLRARTARLDALLEGLLEYSRIGRLEAARERVDVGEVLKGVIDLYVPADRFRVEVQDDLPDVYAPRAAVELVLRNVLMNAVKHHHREQGLIRVEGHRESGMAHLAVTDDGPGIPPEYVEQVFQLFQTLKPRDEVEGSGMGLALVKKAVEAHRGTVEIQHPQGGGAAIHMRWPLPADEAEPPARPHEASPSQGGEQEHVVRTP